MPYCLTGPIMTQNNKPEYIWLVRGHWENTRGWRPFEAPQETEKIPDEILAAMKLTSVGHFLPAERFPTDNYPRRNDNEGAHRKHQLQIFSNGFVFVSGKSADVLRRFDLGEGALYPTRLWHPDRVVRVPGEFFYLSQGNRKDAFLKERSPEARDWPGGRFIPPSDPTADQLVFSKAALAGPDIWWDVKIAEYFFISDHLASALRQAGVSKDWQLLRCQVADL